MCSGGQQGSPDSTLRVFGSVVTNANKVAKGNVHGVDAVKHGRSLICTGGDSGSGYATFAGAAAVNDGINARWGLCQAIAGGYLVKGQFTIGTAATCAEFVDSNKTIYNATAYSLNKLGIDFKVNEELFAMKIGQHFVDIFNAFDIEVSDFERFISIYNPVLGFFFLE